MTHVLALPNGTELVGDYRIERVLGAGGFGITYLAEELALEREVTIKEYFPGDFAARSSGQDAVPRSRDCAGDYQWGLDRFFAEAQTLARFDHRNIVRVYRYFRANNTGYMVLQFEDGQSLKAWLGGLGRAPRQREIDRILAPLLDALELIHKADFLHRDIAPDNIIIRRDGTPVLIDFGSARGDIARVSRTVSALVKPGYSPYEQYAETASQQGPWSDVYALAATLYHAVTGKRPPDAPSRVVKDELKPAREAALSAYRSGFLAAIDRALALDIDKRPQTIAEWRGDLLAPDPRQPGWIRRAISATAAPGRELTRPPAGGKPLAAAIPPPPDAPGAQGGLLDYIDGLKRHSAGPPVRPAATSPAKDEPGSLAPPATVALPRPRTAPPAALRRATPRQPRRVRTGREKHLRPLAVKLLVGAVVAAVAVGLQDHLAGPDGRAFQTSTGSVQVKTQPPPGMRGPASGAAIAFSQDGSSLVSTGPHGELRIWDGESGAEIRSVDLGGMAAISLAVLGRRVLTGHGDGDVGLWDLDSGERIGRFRRNATGIVSVAFMDEPGRFLAAGEDGAVTIWDARSGAAPAVLIPAHEAGTQSVAYSSRAGYVASGGADRLVKLWDAATGSPIRTLRGHREPVTSLAFSPGGRVLASAALDGSVRLWSMGSRRLLRTLRRQEGRVGGLAFSASGELLASVGEDGTVRVWDVRRGRLVGRHEGRGEGFTAVAFAPEGERLAAVGPSGAVRLWQVDKP